MTHDSFHGPVVAGFITASRVARDWRLLSIVDAFRRYRELLRSYAPEEAALTRSAVAAPFSLQASYGAGQFPPSSLHGVKLLSLSLGRLSFSFICLGFAHREYISLGHRPDIPRSPLAFRRRFSVSPAHVDFTS